MKKLFNFLGGIAPFGVALSMQFIITTIAGIVYMLPVVFRESMKMVESSADEQETIKGIEESLVFPPNVLLVISMIGTLGCGVLFIFWYRRRIRGKARVKISSVFTVKNIGILILIGFGSQFFITSLLTFIQPFFEKYFAYYNELMQSITGGNIFLALLYTVLIAPIVEELIFRGVILNKLKCMMPFLAANLIQAVLFGVYHLNWIQGIYAFAIGIILGYVCHKFNTILAPIVLHMIINASSFFVSAIPANLAEKVYFLIAMLVIGVVFIAFSLIKIKNMEALETRDVIIINE